MRVVRWDPGYFDALPRPLSAETRRYFEGKPGLSLSPGQMSWCQRKRDELGMFILREYPSTLEECFQSPVEGAIYAELIDKLRAEGAIRPWKSTARPWSTRAGTWEARSILASGSFRSRPARLGLSTSTWISLTPVERVSRMLAKGYLYGSHFLPHDAMARQKSGRTFLMELKDAGLANVKAVPRTYDVWIGINKLRGILPRFSFRVPECERGLEALCAYHTVRETSTGIACDEPCHDANSHACDALRVLAEAEAAHMLSSAGSTPNIHWQPVTVRTGFRGDAHDYSEPDILERFFGKPRPKVRVIR